MLHLHIIIIAIVLALLVVSAAITAALHRRDPYSDWGFTAAFCIAFSIGMGLGLVVSLFPFQPKYWFITQHEGTVTSIETRSSSNEDDIVTLFSVGIDSMDQNVLTSDPRFLDVEIGDELAVACSIEWVYAGKDIINCVLSE